MKNLVSLVLFSLTVVLSGCFSFEKSPITAYSERPLLLPDGETPMEEHVVVGNFGWYFFNRLPLVCGNAAVDRFCPWRFFRNDVDVTVLQKRLVDYANERNCDLYELNIFNGEEALMTIGAGGISIPLPYLITFRDVQYSAILVKRDVVNRNGVRIQPNDKVSSDLQELLENIPNGGAK